jgi:hypothetical protein
MNACRFCNAEVAAPSRRELRRCQPDERAALLARVDEGRHGLEGHSVPGGYKIGINAGEAASTPACTCMPT